MILFYYYHIPKTGGNYINKLFRLFTRKLNAKRFDYNNSKNITIKQPLLEIDFKEIEEACNQYEYIFVHHHHGYRSLKHYQQELTKLKDKLVNRGDSMYIISSVREILPYWNSRLNFHLQKGKTVNINQYLHSHHNHNHQVKYLLYNTLIQQKNEKLPEISINNVLDILKLVDIWFRTDKLHQFNDFLEMKISKKLNIPSDEIINKSVKKVDLTPIKT